MRLEGPERWKLIIPYVLVLLVAIYVAFDWFMQTQSITRSFSAAHIMGGSRVYDAGGNSLETHARPGDFRE